MKNSIEITEELYRRIEQEAQRRGVTVDAIAREAVNAHLVSNTSKLARKRTK